MSVGPGHTKLPGDAPLPRLLVLTDRTQTVRPLPEVVAAAVAGGARAVVLREKDLPRPERAALAAQLRPLLARVGGVLLCASDAAITADGVHLASDDPLPAPRPPILGRSCHTGDDVTRAAREGADYATLSPVAASASKPGYGPPLDRTRFAMICAGTGLRVYALGGVTAGNAGRWVAAGAHGVAVMGTVMRAERPDRTVAALLDELHAAPQGRPPR